jgi:hypothetical protein
MSIAIPSKAGRSRLKSAAIVVMGLSGILQGNDVSGGQHLESIKEPDAWKVLFNGREILVYSCAPWSFKPYVKELRTPTGENVLRDAPHDHLHHHGLMYGIKVNGMNFWEEVSGSGVQKPVKAVAPVPAGIDVDGVRLPQARLTQVLHWLAPQDAFLPDTTALALLIEQRTLVLTLNTNLNEVALEWESRFQVGARTNAVLLSGAHYHGLGMRFPADLDPFALHSLAGTSPDLSHGRQDVSVAPWASVLFDAHGHALTLVLAGHPSNPGGDPAFFSMRTPFAYLSATQRLDAKPVEYLPGDRFQLRYLILLYSESKPSESLNNRVRQWQANETVE